MPAGITYEPLSWHHSHRKPQLPPNLILHRGTKNNFKKGDEKYILKNVFCFLT